MCDESDVIVGLVLTLAGDDLAQAACEQALACVEGLELGERKGCWLPVVGQACDPMELHRQMERFPGVSYVDVAFVELATERPEQSLEFTH